MARISSTFETVASGTTLTTGNTNYTQVTPGTTNTIAADNTPPRRSGQTSWAKFALGSTNASFASWSDTAWTPVNTTVYGRCSFYVTANPAGTIALFGVYTATFTGQFAVRLLTTGALAVYNAAGTQVAAFTNTVPLSSPFRVEFSMFADPAGTAGTCTVKFFSGVADTAPLETVNLTAQGFGTTLASRSLVGPATGARVGYNIWAADHAMSDVDWLGPVNPYPFAPFAAPRRRPGRRFQPLPFVESGTVSVTGNQLVPVATRTRGTRRVRVLARVNPGTTSPAPGQVVVPPPRPPQPLLRVRRAAVRQRRPLLTLAPLSTPSGAAQAVAARLRLPRLLARTRATAEPVRAQVNPPWQPVVARGLRRVAAPRRDPAVAFVPAGQQQPPAPRITQTTTGQGRRRPLQVLRRAPRGDVSPPADQEAASGALSVLRRRLGPMRRPRVVSSPVPVQQLPLAPPLPLAEARGLRRFLTLARRGRVAAPVPAQVPPAAPRITQTTTGRVRRTAAVRRRPVAPAPVHAAYNPALGKAPSSPRRTPPARRRQVEAAPPAASAARVQQPARRALRQVLAVVRSGSVAVVRVALPYVRPGNVTMTDRPAPALTVEQVTRPGVTSADRPKSAIRP